MPVQPPPCGSQLQARSVSCSAGTALLAVAITACGSTPSPASAPRGATLQIPSPHPTGAVPFARGRTVPGSQIAMPIHACAGSTVEGTAPEGSRIEAGGQVLHPDTDRRFRLHIPVEAQGLMPVRVILPDGRTMVLHIEIQAR